MLCWFEMGRRREPVRVFPLSRPRFNTLAVSGHSLSHHERERAATLCKAAFAARTRIRLRPQIRRDNPLNLSILLSGGKETNQDSLSSGERRGRSPAPNPRPAGGRGKCGVRKTACPVSLGGLSPSDRGSARGRCEAGNGPRRAGVRSSRSRVVWECSPKRVVNSI